jgi:hypothetical protein
MINYYGTDSFTFVANDGYLDSDTAKVSITVNPVNDPPTIEIEGSAIVDEGKNLVLNAVFYDPDGDPLTYWASNLPYGASFDDGELIWATGYDQAGDYKVIFQVNDGSVAVQKEIELKVNNVNRPPEFSVIDPQTVNEGENLLFTITATDPDGDSMIYETISLPSGATFDVQTQNFSWVPDYNQAGEYKVDFVVKDALGASATQEVNITVVNVPDSVDLIKKCAWPEHNRFDISRDEDALQTLYGQVKNVGPGTTNVKVVFTLQEKSESGNYQVETETVSIGPDETMELNTLWTPILGKYDVSAQCMFDSTGDGLADKLGTKSKTFKFSVVP